MKTMSQIYKDSLDAWCRGDVEAMSEPYAEDIVWYPNRSMRPVHGKAGMLGFMQKFGGGMTDMRYEQTLLIEKDNMLFVEGSENYTKKGKKISIPYAGVLEFKGDKIVAWRDYFDLKSLDAQLAA